MKKTILFSITMFFYLLLCTQCYVKVEMGNYFMSNKSVAAIVDSFTQQNRNKKMHELYIDKLSPDTVILILYAGERSLIEKENQHYNQQSSVKVLSNKVLINVYTGLERYIQRYPERKNEPIETLSSTSVPDGAYWVITDCRGKLTTEKNYGGVYPFMTLPLLNKNNMYTPPAIESE